MPDTPHDPPCPGARMTPPPRVSVERLLMLLLIVSAVVMAWTLFRTDPTSIPAFAR